MIWVPQFKLPSRIGLLWPYYKTIHLPVECLKFLFRQFRRLLDTTPDIEDDWVVIFPNKYIKLGGRREVALLTRYHEQRSRAAKIIQRNMQRHHHRELHLSRCDAWIMVVSKLTTRLKAWKFLVTKLLHVRRVRRSNIGYAKLQAAVVTGLSRLVKEKKRIEQVQQAEVRELKMAREQKAKSLTLLERRSDPSTPDYKRHQVYLAVPIILGCRSDVQLRPTLLDSIFGGFKPVLRQTHQDTLYLKFISGLGYSGTVEHRLPLTDFTPPNVLLISSELKAILELPPVLFTFEHITPVKLPEWVELPDLTKPGLYALKPVFRHNKWILEFLPFIHNTYGCLLLSTVAWCRRQDYLTKTTEIPDWRQSLPPVIPLDFELLPRVDASPQDPAPPIIGNVVKRSTFKKAKGQPPKAKACTCSKCGTLFQSKKLYKQHFVRDGEGFACGSVMD